MKLPFGWLPGHWGLKGTTRAIAKAEYELTGYDLDIELAKIKFKDEPNKLGSEYDRIMLKHGKITQREYDTAQAHREYTGTKLEAVLLEIAYDNGELTDNEFNKKLATLKGEPYIAVIDSDYDPALVLDGFHFEFDWNEKWIETLIEHGYAGASEDLIVQAWFEDVCRAVVADSFDQNTVPFNSQGPQRPSNRIPREGGKADYT